MVSEKFETLEEWEEDDGKLSFLFSYYWEIALYSWLEVLSYRSINEHWKVVIHGISMAKECL